MKEPYVTQAALLERVKELEEELQEAGKTLSEYHSFHLTTVEELGAKNDELLGRLLTYIDEE